MLNVVNVAEFEIQNGEKVSRYSLPVPASRVSRSKQVNLASQTTDNPIMT
jgi:hypothetical protein